MDEIAKRMAAKIEADMFTALCGGRMPSRPTALAYRGGRFVSLPIGDDGNVIEPEPPCPRCGPVLLCAKHAAMVGF